MITVIFMAIIVSFGCGGGGGGGGDSGLSSSDGTSTDPLPLFRLSAPRKVVPSTVGDAIQFTGSCIDDEDGHIGDAFLVWSSHVDGQSALAKPSLRTL